MSAGMLNFWTALVFCLAMLAGWLILKTYESRRQAPENRVRAHLIAMLDLPLAEESPEDEHSDALLFQKQQSSSQVLSWLIARQRRLKTVCCSQERLFIISETLLALLVAILLIWMLPMDSWWGPLLLLLSPFMVLVFGYRFMVHRFKKRFLAQFPNALDLIIRAVRAGVPANQAISAASKEFSDPLHTEFGLMGDGLRLGLDLKEVLDEAERRIGVAEFSFFCVCLLLQRETGGPLTETLENLAQIIRARTELQLKARALTAETRTASKVIAAIPAVVISVMWFLNHDYIATLFTTSGGLFLLKLSLGLVVTGLLVIQHLANLKV